MARDYTKEIGIPSNKKTVSRPIAFVILALVAGGITYGVVNILKHAKTHHAEEKPAASAPASP